MYCQIVLRAHPSMTGQINEAWREAGFEGQLLSTEASIARELDYLRKAGTPFSGLEFVRSISAFEYARPNLARNCGEIVVRAYDAPSLLAESRRKVGFVRDHLEAFDRVAGLRDACDMLNVPYADRGYPGPTCQLSLVMPVLM